MRLRQTSPVLAASAHSWSRSITSSIGSDNPHVINSNPIHARLPWQIAIACLLVFLAAVKPSLAQSQAPNSTSGPEISLTPYLWTAGLGGDVGFRGQSGSIDASFGDILKNVKMGFTSAGTSALDASS